VSVGASSVTLLTATTLNALKAKPAGAKDVSLHALLMLTAILSCLSAFLDPLATVLNVLLILTALLPCHASTAPASLSLVILALTVLVLRLPPPASGFPMLLAMSSPSSANALNAVLMLTVTPAPFAKTVFVFLVAPATLDAPLLLPSAHLNLPLFKVPAVNVPRTLTAQETLLARVEDVFL
jgi:hypothetical protein